MLVDNEWLADGVVVKPCITRVPTVLKNDSENWRLRWLEMLEIVMSARNVERGSSMRRRAHVPKGTLIQRSAVDSR
jgi:hypothetical protein